jgi:hypothetical protein
LPIATGKKAQAEKTPKPLTGTSFAEPRTRVVGLAKSKDAAVELLEELLDAVSRSDCEDKARYDTLEFLCEYVAGRKGLPTGTKFILGII